MALPRPAHALAAAALAGFAYLAPWAMGGLGGGPVVTLIEPAELTAPREPLRFTLPPPEPEGPVEAEGPPEPAPEPAQAAVEVVSAGEPEGALDTTLLTLAPAPLRARGLKDVPVKKPERLRRPPEPPPARAARECDPPDPRVAEVHDTGFRIERGLIDHYANHVQEIEALAASWWARDEADERVGFRIGRMKCGALLRQAGFRNGDVIVGINGLPVTSWTEGVKAYMAVRNKDLLWVDVERRGEPVRLDYLLVGEGEAAAPVALGDRFEDPSALVERELELAELPWLARRSGKRDDRRAERAHEREGRRAEAEVAGSAQARRLR